MIADEDRIVFEVKPNAAAYRYSAMAFAASLACIGLLIYELINPPVGSSFGDKMIIYSIIILTALLLVPFALIPIYKRVSVDEDSITIKKFNRSVTINVEDIYFLSTERKYHTLKETIYMLVIKYDNKELVLQDTFTSNFFAFQYYLVEFVNRSKCEVDLMYDSST